MLFFLVLSVATACAIHQSPSCPDSDNQPYPQKPEGNVASCRASQIPECNLISAKVDVTKFGQSLVATLQVAAFVSDDKKKIVVYHKDRYGLPFNRKCFNLNPGYSELHIPVESTKPPSDFGDGCMQVNWLLLPIDRNEEECSIDVWSALDFGYSDWYHPK